MEDGRDIPLDIRYLPHAQAYVWAWDKILSNKPKIIPDGNIQEHICSVIKKPEISNLFPRTDVGILETDGKFVWPHYFQIIENAKIGRMIQNHLHGFEILVSNKLFERCFMQNTESRNLKKGYEALICRVNESLKLSH